MESTPQTGFPARRTCSSLDHIWKVSLWTDRVQPKQKCLCGEREWGVEYKPKKVKR